MRKRTSDASPGWATSVAGIAVAWIGSDSERMSEQLAGIAPRDAFDLLGGEVGDLSSQHRLRVGPRRVRVRVVALHEHTVGADQVHHREASRLLDRAEPEVAVHDLARGHAG